MSLTAGRCPVCRAAPREIIEQAEPPYRVVKCADCSLAYVDPLPDEMELSRHYDQDYYAAWISVQAARRRLMWKRRLAEIESLIPKGNILDIGCGEGSFLEVAQQNGWEVQGTDVSSYATNLASQRLGRNVFCGQIWEAGFNASSFDVITMWHVLEHTVSPLRTLQEVWRLLRPGGFLVLAVPNRDDKFMQVAYRLVRGKKPRLFSITDKEIHLFHFSVLSLTSMLEKVGFTSIKAGPDFGIVELTKRLINSAAALFFYFLQVHWYNSIQVTARRR